MLTAARLFGYHNITLCDQQPSGQAVCRQHGFPLSVISLRIDLPRINRPRCQLHFYGLCSPCTFRDGRTSVPSITGFRPMLVYIDILSRQEI